MELAHVPVVLLLNCFICHSNAHTEIKIQLLEYPKFGDNVEEIIVSNYINHRRLSLVCTSHQPVQMVYDYQLQDLKEIYFPQVNQYIERLSYDFNDPSTYQYKAFMNTRTKSFLDLRYIQCSMIGTSSIRREIQFVKNDGVHFEIKGTLNGAAWKCIPDGAENTLEVPSIHFAYCYTSIDCSNLVRNAQIPEPVIKVLKTVEPCIDCLEAFKYISDEKKYHPQLVICTYKGIRRAIPYFFSFPPDGKLDHHKLYLSWNDVRGEDMLFLEKPHSTNVSVGDMLDVSCIGVKYYFSHGYRVGLEINGSLTLIPQGRHTYKRDKLRNAYIIQESILLKEPGIGTVYCFGPVINSSEWINKSYTIFINEKPHAPMVYQDLNPESKDTAWSEGDGNDDQGLQGTLTIVGLVAGMISLILIMGYAFFRRLRQVERKFARLTEAEIQAFRNGAGAGGDATDDDSTHDNDSGSDLKIDALPYNTKYEVPRKQISIDGKQLGAGTYGVVNKGMVWSGTEMTPVAIKTIRVGVEVSYLKALLSELKIMAYLNNEHENIVQLVAACTENIRNKEVYVAVELCKGSLLDELRESSGKSFVNLVENGQLCQETSMSGLAGASYANVTTAQALHYLSTCDLISWSLQIADGMEFLSMKKVIHGDLAARNILLTDHRIAKICDFGLARQLVDYNYVKSEQCPLPWKWMAIESLSCMNFSVKSDIWSYGVTLWEIFSLGQVPYPGLNWTTDFVKELENGLRMSSPDYASHDIYLLMVSCWHIELKERPTFTELKTVFLEMHSSVFGTISLKGGVQEYENVQSMNSAFHELEDSTE